MTDVNQNDLSNVCSNAGPSWVPVPTDTGVRMGDADRVNGLSLLVSDLVNGLVADGRMSPTEAEAWELQADALVFGDAGRLVM